MNAQVVQAVIDLLGVVYNGFHRRVRQEGSNGGDSVGDERHGQCASIEHGVPAKREGHSIVCLVKRQGIAAARQGDKVGRLNGLNRHGLGQHGGCRCITWRLVMILRDLFCRIGGGLIRQPEALYKAGKLMPQEEVARPRAIHRLGSNVLEGEPEGHVSTDCSQFSREVCALAAFGKLALESGGMMRGFQRVVNAVKRAVLRNKLEGSLLANAGDAGDIIRAVTHQSLDVDKLRRRHAVALKECRLVHIDGGGISRQQNVHAGGDKLEGIPIPRQQVGAALLRVCLGHGGQCAQDIIRLVTLAIENMEAENIGQLTGNGHLRAQFIRHGVAAGLIGLVHIMSEGGGLQIVSNSGIVRRKSLELAGDHVNQSIKGVGGESVLGCQEADAVKGTVQNRISVNAQEFFHG